MFLATRAAVGYGFEVWKMDADFADGKQIISGLSGCCGQMDVKANANGLFVAENSKHRVCRYDHDGKLICNWGHGARKGLEGFGSCCNPMNVAFGPGDVVYTAEDNTGRIKRYSPEGELLGLVGVGGAGARLQELFDRRERRWQPRVHARHHARAHRADGTLQAGRGAGTGRAKSRGRAGRREAVSFDAQPGEAAERRAEPWPRDC